MGEGRVGKSQCIEEMYACEVRLMCMGRRESGHLCEGGGQMCVLEESEVECICVCTGERECMFVGRRSVRCMGGGEIHVYVYMWNEQ